MFIDLREIYMHLMAVYIFYDPFLNVWGSLKVNYRVHKVSKQMLL